METLYHATTPKKAKLYNQTGFIVPPVRGFDTLSGAMARAIKVGRTVIYEIHCNKIIKLPDHHNYWGTAYWTEDNVYDKKCVFSADTDA